MSTVGPAPESSSRPVTMVAEAQLGDASGGCGLLEEPDLTLTD